MLSVIGWEFAVFMEFRLELERPKLGGTSDTYIYTWGRECYNEILLLETGCLYRGSILSVIVKGAIDLIPVLSLNQDGAIDWLVSLAVGSLRNSETSRRFALSCCFYFSSVFGQLINLPFPSNGLKVKSPKNKSYEVTEEYFHFFSWKSRVASF